ALSDCAIESELSTNAVRPGKTVKLKTIREKRCCLIALAFLGSARTPILTTPLLKLCRLRAEANAPILRCTAAHVHTCLHKHLLLCEYSLRLFMCQAAHRQQFVRTCRSGDLSAVAQHPGLMASGVTGFVPDIADNDRQRSV